MSIPGRISVWLWCLVLLAIAGCATPRNLVRRPQLELPQPTGQCIATAKIRDFRAKGVKELRVRTEENDWQYLLVLDRECPNLADAQRIGWTSQRGKICDYRHDAILVDGERCAIGRIEDYAAGAAADRTTESAVP
ncbi:MAG: DUF6491 family protein [Candidatus Binatia bacterium]|nr:DUF6491 family protein [Candidatus Binatia bacterium]MDG1958747.1 DUF6491 family protein [Candidatus Binatia bacterium]MDG2008945.1 DUF6491 family protein [Candidatus Binatia bacterium]